MYPLRARVISFSFANLRCMILRGNEREEWAEALSCLLILPGSGESSAKGKKCRLGGSAIKWKLKFQKKFIFTYIEKEKEEEE